MSEEKITKEQFYNWKQHPVTIEFFKEINLERERIKEGLALGQTLNSSSLDSTVSNVWLAVGQARAFEFVLNTEFGGEE